MLLCAAVVVAQEPPPQQEKIPEFAVGTELVRIDVVVTDENGQPISSLTRDDFALFEDESPRRSPTSRSTRAADP